MATSFLKKLMKFHICRQQVSFILLTEKKLSRCTTWTKEIGMLVTNCPELAEDAVKIHDIYMNIKGELPKRFPSNSIVL